MTKFKKEYNHQVEDIVEACGFSEDDFEEMLMRGVETWEKTERMSVMVEQIEKYAHEYDPDTFRRFLIAHFVSYLTLKHEKNANELIHKIMSGKFQINNEDVLILEETKSGELKQVDSFKKSDNPELHEKLTQHACEKCNKKETCTNLNDNQKENTDEIIKH